MKTTRLDAWSLVNSINRKSRWVADGLSFLLIAGLGIAWWQMSPVLAQSESPMSGGARHVTIEVHAEGKAILNLVCFHQDKFRLMVVANPLPQEDRRIAGKAQDHRAIAGCNGGYFIPPTLMPSGPEVAEGVPTGSPENLSPMSLFGVRNDTPFFALEKGFQLTTDLSGLVRCGPPLVDGRWVLHQPGSDITARTFVMTDGNGQWAIGTADRMSLNDLAALLARPGLIKGFRVQHAMNLDGGPSSGLWWQDKEGHAHEQRERWRVRNMLLVVPR